jgi:hypothetical protein
MFPWFKPLISLLGLVGMTVAVHANSCINVDVIGTFDQSGIVDNEYQTYAVGTFRIPGEADESRQPMFNLATITCDKVDSNGARVAQLECKVVKAVVSANPENPNPAKPNCSLDLDSSGYQMKEMQRGILSGIETSSGCYDSMLTINKNTQRVYLSFTRSAYADNMDRIRSGTCGQNPRTQTLMNCTSWPRIRTPGSPARYCDFSGSSSK